MTEVYRLWVYLSASPLLWLTATLLAYALGQAVHRWCGGHPLANPVAIAIALLVAVLSVSGTDYPTYFDGAQFVHFLLGPATVALAVPLFRHLGRVRRALVPIAAALLAGSLTAIVSAVLTARLLGAAPETMASLAPKSVTTPIAMALADSIGGLASLAAVLVIATGILGAMFGAPLVALFRIRDRRATGLAVGTAAHGIGTARMFQLDEVSGTFAAIAMSLNGLVTAVLVPLIVTLLL
ncbi:MAG: LrgB family protein [Alphaproteobacteria bacterium]|jgi:predicted murein hydrolase (TIGR00659 family)|nr:LrgB family protein [Alphaproteobacteria bacterium]